MNILNYFKFWTYWHGYNKTHIQPKSIKSSFFTSTQTQSNLKVTLMPSCLSTTSFKFSYFKHIATISIFFFTSLRGKALSGINRYRYIKAKWYNKPTKCWVQKVSFRQTNSLKNFIVKFSPFLRKVFSHNLHKNTSFNQIRWSQHKKAEISITINFPVLFHSLFVFFCVLIFFQLNLNQLLFILHLRFYRFMYFFSMNKV